MQKPNSRMGLKDISGLNLRMVRSVLEEHPTRMGAILRNEMERGRSVQMKLLSCDQQRLVT